jgi:hypothetical protein
MSTFIILLLAFISTVFAFLSGWVATRIGKNFHFWFWLSVLLPVIALCILLCMPEKQGKLIVIEKADQFSHLFNEEDVNTILN